MDYITKLRKSHAKQDLVKANKIIAYLDALEKHGLALTEPYIKKSIKIFENFALLEIDFFLLIEMVTNSLS